MQVQTSDTRSPVAVPDGVPVAVAPLTVRAPIGFRRGPNLKSARSLGGHALFIVAEIAVAIGLWQLIVTVSHSDPHVLPGPKPVWTSLKALAQSGVLLKAVWVTLKETLIGFVLGTALGILVAVALDQSRLLRKVMNPYIVAFQAIPKIAIAPLFLIWFGFGIASKVVLITSLVFFPVLINMMSGLSSISSDQHELMLVYRASRFDQLRHLKWYAALPFLLAAAEVCLVLSPTAAVFAEILGSGTSTGLGTLIQLYSSRIDMGGLFAVVVVLSVLGVLLHLIVLLTRKFLIRWNPAGGR